MNTEENQTGSLGRQLLAEDTRPVVIAACVALIQTRVAAQTGFAGGLVRHGFRLLHRWRDDFSERAVNKLLPDFCAALEPLHQDWLKAKQPDWQNFLAENNEQAVSALLGVADQSASTTNKKLVRRIYQQLRPRAERELGAVLPDLANLMNDWLPPSP